MDSKLIPATLLLLTVFASLWGIAVVGGDSRSGSFSFRVDGYTVTGDLTNAAVEHGGAVQMLMSIDQTVTTSYGVVHITGNGVWSGQTNFQAVNGAIGNVAGTVQACAVFYCQNADFTGAGTWMGTLIWSSDAGSQGSGSFQGALTFSGQGVNETGAVPISGNWTATFES